MIYLRAHPVRFGLALASSLALALVALWARPAAAFDFRSGDTITIGRDEVIDDDLFLAGTTVVVDGTVNGDLFVTGRDLTINGTVNGSLAFGGQTLTLNGRVKGSVYGGGMSVRLGPQASVGRNALFGGMSYRADAGSAIGRDMLMGGYQAVLDGKVGRDVKFSGSALELNGSVGGDVLAEVDEPGPAQMPPLFAAPGMPSLVAPGLRVGPQATVGGKLTYTSPVEQSDAIQSAPVGGVVYEKSQPPAAARRQRPEGLAFRLIAWALDRARDFLTLLILGGLALWRLPAWLSEATDKAQTQPLPAAGWGLVVVSVGYIGIGLAALMILALGIFFGIVTLGGLAQTVFGMGISGLGLILTLFTLLVAYGSKLVVAYLVGRWSVQRLAPRAAYQNAWALLVGILAYVLIRSIPLLGWTVGVLVTLLGVGAIWLALRDRRAALVAPGAN